MFKGKMKKVAPSLVAAALTAVAFAAVSVAKDDDGDKESAGPRGGPGVMFFHERPSDEDRAAMEEFRQCMQDNGAPPPPEPPTEAEREAIDKALEACEDKLPEGVPAPGAGGPCGPPHGPPPGVENQGSVVEPEGLKRS